MGTMDRKSFVDSFNFYGLRCAGQLESYGYFHELLRVGVQSEKFVWHWKSHWDEINGHVVLRGMDLYCCFMYFSVELGKFSFPTMKRKFVYNQNLMLENSLAIRERPPTSHGLLCIVVRLYNLIYCRVATIPF